MEFIMLEFNWRVNVTLAYGYMKRMLEWLIYWVRLNYATTHHDPPRPTTIHHHPPPSTTTTHHHPKYIHHHPQPLTTIHHLPSPAKIYPPPPTTSQNISITTYHFPKSGPPSRKSQNIFIYNIL